MPSLEPADRVALLGPLHSPCQNCHAEQIRHYCRSCDEFFTQCDCPPVMEIATHIFQHRVYLWTPAGILAIPDLDTFRDVAPKTAVPNNDWGALAEQIVHEPTRLCVTCQHPAKNHTLGRCRKKKCGCGGWRG